MINACVHTRQDDRGNPYHSLWQEALLTQGSLYCSPSSITGLLIMLSSKSGIHNGDGKVSCLAVLPRDASLCFLYLIGLGCRLSHLQ